MTGIELILQGRLAQLDDRIVKLEAENARLREALGPFAEAVRKAKAAAADHRLKCSCPWQSFVTSCHHEVEDYEAAAKALEENLEKALEAT